MVKHDKVRGNCYITPPIWFRFGFFLARLANRILPFQVVLKLNITREMVDAAFAEEVEVWDL